MLRGQLALVSSTPPIGLRERIAVPYPASTRTLCSEALRLRHLHGGSGSTADKSSEETAALRNRLVEAREKRKREREEHETRNAADKAYAQRRGSTSADNA